MNKQNSVSDRKIGLALGGGAVFGYAHIGVLKAIDEFQIPISFISGTSVGSLVGALYAFGKTWVEILELAQNAGWLAISGVSLTSMGLLSNKKLGILIKKTLNESKIEDATRPLAIMTTDITTGERVALRKGDVAQAVMASTCLPGIFNPVDINDRLLVDGGLIENVPVTPLIEMGADYLISVDLTSHYRAKKPRNVAEVLINAFHTMHAAVARLQEEKVDLAIKPNLTSFNVVDTKQMDKLVEVGYQEAKRVLENSDLVNKRTKED